MARSQSIPARSSPHSRHRRRTCERSRRVTVVGSAMQRRDIDRWLHQGLRFAYWGGIRGNAARQQQRI